MNKLFVQGSVFLLSLLLLLSCSDDKLSAGLEILPEADQLEAKADTLPIECYTYKGIAGIASSTKESTVNYPIGHVYDDIFGETYADVVLELLYNSKDNYKVDTLHQPDEAISLKLYLNISDLDIYGESDAFDIDIYLLKSRYSYNGNTLQHVPADFFSEFTSRSIQTEHNVFIGNNDIAQLDSGKYLVIELDNELAKTLTDTIYNTTDFFSAFPGLVLRANKKDNPIGGLQNFTLKNSKLILEYKRPGIDLNGNDSTFYSSFDISKYQLNYRNNHTERGAEIETAFRDTIHQIDKFYLQSLGGTRGIIKFNSLIDFKKDKIESGTIIAVNLAELILPINKDYLIDTILFKLPKRIVAQGLRPSLTMIPDDGEAFSAYYFNGYLDLENLVYRINLSEYVHRYMSEDLDYILLNITTAENNANKTASLDYKTPSRVVLNSGLNEITDRAFIRVIYTLIYN